MRVQATPTGGQLSFYATYHGDQASKEQAVQMLAIMNQKKVVLDVDPEKGRFMDVKV